MTLKVIENAFVEGRETDTAWEQSIAKTDQIKLETFANNVENFNGRKMNQVIPLEQICPTTGKVLRTFGSRLDAARWVVENVLGVNDPDGKKALSITGNMHMCMGMGWKSYGFLWRRINAATHTAKLVEVSSKLRSTAVHILDLRTHVVKPITMPSIAEAAKVTGVSERQIRRIMAEGMPAYNGFVFREFRATMDSKNFENEQAAADFFGVKRSYIRKVFAAGGAINNTKFTLESAPKEVLKVYQGRNVVGTFADAAKVARYLGVARTTVTRCMRDDRLIDGKYRCTRANVRVRASRRKSSR